MDQDGKLQAAPVRMLHVFPSFALGGQQSRFAALARGLGTDFSHRVIALDGIVAARELLSGLSNVEVEAMPFQASRFVSPRNIARLKAAIVAGNTDILCGYNFGAIEAALAARAFPHLAHIHFEDGFGPDETIDRQKRRRIWARRLLLRRATVVVPSHGLEAVARDIWRLKAGRVIRIPNAVDSARFDDRGASLRQRVTVGSIGALRPEKNFERLIDAFAQVGAGARLVIYGDGPQAARLKKAAGAHYGADITLPGATIAVEEAYARFDIFALSSDTEQAPLTVIEAMAAGLPVVAPAVGDIAEMVSEENRPYITPSGDDRAFTDALAHLLQNPHARAALGAANRRKAREVFDFAAMVERFRALFTASVRTQ